MLVLLRRTTSIARDVGSNLQVASVQTRSWRVGLQLNPRRKLHRLTERLAQCTEHGCPTPSSTFIGPMRAR